MKRINIYYDGFCPFCKSYVRLQRLKEEYDVHLFDLREAPKKISEFLEKGYNVDQGMIIEIDDRTFSGSEAVYTMALLQDQSVIGVFWKSVFFNFKLTSYFYPVLVFFRNLTLIILRRPKINKK